MTQPNINLQWENISYIDRLQPTDLYVLWILGNQCTYHCSYCPDHFHNGKLKYQPIEVIQRTLNLLPKSYVWFTGGEATFHPDFEEIVLNKPDHINISVISNGSRPIGFWERITEKLYTVILTFHAEFADIDRFLETCKLIYVNKKRYGRVNVTMIPELWDKCINAVETFKSNGIRVTPKPLVENFGFQASNLLSRYSDKQLEYISQLNTTDDILNIGAFSKNNNLLFKTNPSQLLSTKQNNFKDWLCHTSTQTLYIDGDGTVFDTSCKQRENKGNIYEIFTLSKEPKICNQTFCWCHTDLLPKKQKL